MYKSLSPTKGHFLDCNIIRQNKENTKRKYSFAGGRSTNSQILKHFGPDCIEPDQ